MKKKTTIWTYAKRALLVVVLAVVLIFVSIYFLDVYKVAANINDFDNEYEDSYWDNLEENGFVSFQEIKDQRDSSQISGRNGKYTLGPTYKVPFAENATDVEKLNSARFGVELNYFYEVLIENKTPEVETLYASFSWLDTFTPEVGLVINALSCSITSRLSSFDSAKYFR